MSTEIGIGFSQDSSVEIATKEAVETARKKLRKPQAGIVIVLSTIHYDPEVTIPVIRETFPQAKIIGCSTAGVLLTDFIETQGIAIAAVGSDDINFGTGAVYDLDSNDGHVAGQNLVDACLKDIGETQHKAFIFFIDGQLPNNSPFLKGLKGVIGNAMPIIGAGSSDDFHFSRTFQIYDNAPLKNSAVGLMVGGNIDIGMSNKHGWRPLGKPRIVDQSSGNVIHSINGRKAINLYEEYFSIRADEIDPMQLSRIAVLYPLGIYSEGSNKYLLRHAINILEDGSIVCQGHVPENSEVHIMIGNKESYVEAAIEAAKEAHARLNGKKAKFVMIFECMTRFKLLGRIAMEELKKIREIFGPDVPILGMYSNGEIYPFNKRDQSNATVVHHQNESISIMAVS